MISRETGSNRFWNENPVVFANDANESLPMMSTFNTRDNRTDPRGSKGSKKDGNCA
jgi:hypothetical protein